MSTQSAKDEAGGIDDENEEQDHLCLFRNNIFVDTSCTVLDCRTVRKKDYVVERSIM